MEWNGSGDENGNEDEDEDKTMVEIRIETGIKMMRRVEIKMGIDNRNRDGNKDWNKNKDGIKWE